MAASVVWPKDLDDLSWIPSFLWEGYSNIQQDVVVRSQMDSGPGITRRRFSGFSVYHTGKAQLTSKQLLILDSWYTHELMNGSLSFLWCPPGMYLWYEARFRKPYTIAPVGAPMTVTTVEEGDPLLLRCPDLLVGDKYMGGSWSITFEIEQMPGKGLREPIIEEPEEPPPPPPPPEEQQFTLTVVNSGTGTGQVTSVPAGIDLPADGTEVYTGNTAVTLTALPESGSYLAGWGGDVAAVDQSGFVATVNMTSDKNASVIFNLTPVSKPDLVVTITMRFPDGLYAISSGSLQSSGVRVDPYWSRAGSGVWTKANDFNISGVNPNSFSSNRDFIIHDPDAPAGTTYLIKLARDATWYRKKLTALETAMRLMAVKVTREGLVTEEITGIAQNMNTRIPWIGDRTNDDYGLWVEEPNDRVVREVTLTTAVV